MRALAPSDLPFLASAHLRAHVVAALPAPPDRVFAALADQSTWPRWCADCLDARWTSDVPASSSYVGARRAIRFRFASFEERILAWEPGARFAFSVDGCSIPLARRAAEDWRLTAVDGGTTLEWTLAVDVPPLARAAWPAARLVAEATFRRTAAGLAAFVR